MRLIKATKLARLLGISRRTVAKWYQTDPALVVRKGRDYYVKLDQLALKPGFDLVAALTIESACWIKAVDFAAAANHPRKSVANWCKGRSRFAKRIGRIWYVDLAEMDLTEEQIATLKSKIPVSNSG